MPLTRPGLASPSTITRVEVVPNAVQITGASLANLSYVLEAGTNLVNWLPAQTNNADGSGVYSPAQRRTCRA